jgi:hypothetical protein
VSVTGAIEIARDSIYVGSYTGKALRARRAYIAVAVLGGTVEQCVDAERYGKAWDVRSAVTFVCYRAAMIGMGAKP